jgi:hypothetical protein
VLFSEEVRRGDVKLDRQFDEKLTSDEEIYFNKFLGEDMSMLHDVDKADMLLLIQ